MNAFSSPHSLKPELTASQVLDIEGFNFQARWHLDSLPELEAKLMERRRAMMGLLPGPGLDDAIRREGISAKAFATAIRQAHRFQLAARLRAEGHPLGDCLDLACLPNPSGERLKPLPEAMG